MGCQYRCVCAFVLGDSCQAGSVKSNAVQVTFQRRFLCGGEVDKAFGFIDRVDCRDFPFALGKLCELLALEVKQIQVAIPAAFAGPQETLAIFQQSEIVTHVDPIRVIFAENGACLARGSVRNQQIERSEEHTSELQSQM